MLQERPHRVRQCSGHCSPLPVEFLRAERRIPGHLAVDLFQIAKRALPNIVHQFSWGLLAMHNITLMNHIGRVTHAPLSEELRLAIVGVPARMPNPSTHEIVPPRYEIGIMCRSPGKEPENFVAHLRCTTLI